jgi:hypothetical protein
MAAPYTRVHHLPPPYSYLVSGIPSLWIALVVHQLVILWRHLARPDTGVQLMERTADMSTDTRTPTDEDDATDRGGDGPDEEAGQPDAGHDGRGPRPRRRADVDERTAAVRTYLRTAMDAGRDPAKVPIAEVAEGTKIPRSSVYRLLPDALEGVPPEGAGGPARREVER